MSPAFAIAFIPFALQTKLAPPPVATSLATAPAATPAPTPPPPMPLAPLSLKGMDSPMLQLAKQDWRGSDRRWPAEPPVTPAGPQPEPPVVIVAPPAPLPAPPEDRATGARPAEGQKLSQGGFELALGALAYRPDLSRVHFSGSGVPIDGIRGRQNFHHKGSELGIQKPMLLGGDVAIRYLRRYFVLGVSGFIAGNSGGADATPIPANTEATMLVSARSLMAYGGAVEIEGALPLGPATIRVGPVTGVRAYKVDLPGFQATECKTRRNRNRGYPCAETAGTNAQPFLQPRVSIDFSAAPDKSESFFVGLSGGVDVFGGASYWGGLALGVRSSHGGLLP